MPTVRAPTSREMRATTGAAPVPVPPPAPAVMNTMSAPLSSALSSSYCSSAALRPMSGSAPAPRPRVASLPMCTRVGALDCSSDCTSVLTAMNSTPSTWASIIRSTAFTPAPPTPITRSTGSRCRGEVGRWISSTGSWRRGAVVALHDVLGDVGGEDRPQALLRRGDALVARRRALLARKRAPPAWDATRGGGARARSRAGAWGACASGVNSRRAAGVRSTGSRVVLARRTRTRALRTRRPPRPRSNGRARPGGPPSCSRAYRLPCPRTSFASWR